MKTILACTIIGMFACAASPRLFAGASCTQQATQSATTQNAAPQTGSAQTTAPSPDDPRFAAFVYDVVSIKPHKDDPNARSIWMGMQNETDGVTMRRVGVEMMLSAAFGNQYSKFSRLPNWASSESYDVDAKMEPEVADAFQKLSPADQKIARRHMMQAFVREYLKAAVHIETNEVASYDLVIAKNGPKLKEVTDPAIPDRGFSVMGSKSGTVLEAHATQIATLLGQVSYEAGRPVFDKTGLTGKYEFTLKYSHENLNAAPPGPDGVPAPPADASPPMAKALEEQLGLKLVPAKGNVDLIVIDHVEKPSGN